MARFNESEYSGYVRLMRDLKLEHTYQAGDRFGRDLEAGKIGVGIQGINVRRPEDWWLPSSDDWDEMLEEVGFSSVRIERVGKGWIAAGAMAGEEPPHEYERSAGRHFTPIEARARLWLNSTPK